MILFFIHINQCFLIDFKIDVYFFKTDFSSFGLYCSFVIILRAVYKMSEDFPPELEDACKKFEVAMNSVETSIAPLFKNERSELIRSATLLDAAKVDLVSVYAINSFYWAYLIMQGIDPKKHTVKVEVDRVRSYMSRIEEIKNRKNRPTLAKDAAKRFVRNAMFEAEEKKMENDNKNNKDKQNNTRENDVTVSTECSDTKQLKRKLKKKHKSSKRSKKN